MEAEKTVARSGGARHKFHYTPAVHIGEVDGVRKRSDTHEDCYSGTKEQLVSIGLVPDGLFPGDPGMPTSSVALWPVGTPKRAAWYTPGKLRISRSLSGKFCAWLAVSAEEQERRKARHEVEQADRRAKYEAAERLRKAERLACSSLHVIIQELGCAEVLDQVYKVRREQTPPRATGHLRLVWSAPAD